MGRKFKILFVLRSSAYFHHYRSAIFLLAERGHEISMLLDKEWSKSKNASLEPFEKLKKNFSNFDYAYVSLDRNFFGKIIYHAREIKNYRDFLLGQNQSGHYRARQINYVHYSLRILLKAVPGATNGFLRLAATGRALDWLEQNIGASESVKNYLKIHKPDIVIAAPVNMRCSSADLEYLKAAKECGIPTVLPVISWDNLTTKGLIHVLPDLLLVWNEAQVEVAKTRHGVPGEKIKIIGAMPFDLWFSGLKPSVSSAEFRQRHGISANATLITYLGSSPNIARDESGEVEKLLKVFKNFPDERLRSIQIILRPHPAHFKHYGRLESYKDILILPKKGALQISEESAQLFYDTLYNSVAAVGINTSGMIDAILAGKPTISLLAEKYRSTQSETLHFKELVESGAMYLADGADMAAQKIKLLLGGRDELAEKRRAFAINFARPRGINVSAAEAFAEEVENLKRND